MPNVPRRYLWVLATVLVLLIGIPLNPWVVRPSGQYDPIGDGILIVEGALAVVWCLAVCWMGVRRCRAAASLGSTLEAARPARTSARERVKIALLLAYVLALWLALHWQRLCEPELKVDDYHYVEIAASWDETRRNLFTPYNEHLCVLTRLFTWSICVAVDAAH